MFSLLCTTAPQSLYHIRYFLSGFFGSNLLRMTIRLSQYQSFLHLLRSLSILQRTRCGSSVWLIHGWKLSDELYIHLCLLEQGSVQL